MPLMVHDNHPYFNLSYIYIQIVLGREKKNTFEIQAKEDINSNNNYV